LTFALFFPIHMLVTFIRSFSHDSESMNKHLNRLHQLLETVKEKNKILILTHNNPDPDSLASAFTLKFILNKLLNLSVIVAYGGIVGRAENKAMIKHLKLELSHVTQIKFQQYQGIIIVDTQPQAGNNSLPKEIIPDVVIDHHPLRKATRAVPFYDVRPGHGATSTLAAEYLLESGLEIDDRIATALFYGIKSDTLDLSREATEADRKITFILYPKVSTKILSKIEHPKVPKYYFREFNRALEEAVIYKDAVVSDLGLVKNPDMVPEMADSLLNIEGVKWTLCIGEFREDLFFSLRTSRTSAKAGGISMRMARNIGFAGGHGMMAGGRVPLTSLASQEMNQLKERLISRFLKALNRLDVRSTKLID